MKRVLVVDDEPTICDLIADALRESGYRVDTAPNGAEALDLMRARLPHAIVLDLMMPRLNANGLVEHMRHDPGFAAIPILVVTAAYGAYEAAARLGARACLTKPFELDELVDTIGQLVDEPEPLTAPNWLGPADVPRSTAAES